MACKEIIGHQQQFVEEIDYNEIETEQVVLPTFVLLSFHVVITPCLTDVHKLHLNVRRSFRCQLSHTGLV